MSDFPHQSVRLIAMTQPEEGIFEKGTDAEDLIAYCARVSNPSNQTNFETSGKLLNYCIRKKHWSIFEMVNVVMEVNTTRDIGRQILRHQYKFQEFSQRYAEVDTHMFVVRETRFQDAKNRQSSLSLADILGQHGMTPEAYSEYVATACQWDDRQRRLYEYIAREYDWAIQHGIAKEQARAILPEGATMSCMYIQGTLRNWMHYCWLRQDNGTQREHQDIAEKAWTILSNKFDFLKNIEINS